MRFKNSLLTVFFVSSSIFSLSSKDVYSTVPVGLSASGSSASAEEELAPLLPEEEGQEEGIAQQGTQTQASSDGMGNLPASSASQGTPFFTEALRANETRAQSSASSASPRVSSAAKAPKALPGVVSASPSKRKASFDEDSGPAVGEKDPRMIAAFGKYKKEGLLGVDKTNADDVAAARKFVDQGQEAVIPDYLHGAIGILNQPLRGDTGIVSMASTNIESYEKTKRKPLAEQEGVNAKDDRHKAAANLFYKKAEFPPRNFPLVMHSLNQGDFRIASPDVEQIGAMHEALENGYITSEDAPLANALISKEYGPEALVLAPQIGEAFSRKGGISKPTASQVDKMAVLLSVLNAAKEEDVPGGGGKFLTEAVYKGGVRLATDLVRVDPDTMASEKTGQAFAKVVRDLSSEKSLPTLAQRDQTVKDSGGAYTKDAYAKSIKNLAKTYGAIDPAGLTQAQISAAGMKTQRAADLEERLEELALEEADAKKAKELRDLKLGVHKWRTLK